MENFFIFLQNADKSRPDAPHSHVPHRGGVLPRPPAPHSVGGGVPDAPTTPAVLSKTVIANRCAPHPQKIVIANQ